MKKSLAILIFCSLLFQCLAHFGVIGLFELNRDFIAKNLCENRNKPELKCCGKCYLKKQLKKVDDNNDTSKNGPVKTEKQEVVLFLIQPSPVQVNLSFVAAVVKPFNPRSQHLYGRLLLRSVFHPPTLV